MGIKKFWSRAMTALALLERGIKQRHLTNRFLEVIKLKQLGKVRIKRFVRHACSF